MFLALLFIGPLALAWLLYFGMGGWRPSGNAANGELIDPPVPLAQVAPPLLAGDAPNELFRNVWSLTVLGGNACSAECSEALVKIRQIRLTLGKDMDRVGRVLLLAGPGAQAQEIGAEHPGLVVVDAGSEEAAQLLREFPGAADAGDWIYLVDPLGNLMMRYGWDEESHAIREDLKRLLRLSRIG